MSQPVYDPQQRQQLPPDAPKSGGGCLGAIVVLLLFVTGLVILGQLDSSSDRILPRLGNSVGIVRIEGPINESKDIVEIIQGFQKNSRIKAIVLRLDTPGGSVGASEEIYREVLRVRKEGNVRVVASMGNAAASGGYYIAMAAEEIFANSGTITGSIGVIAPNFNLQETLEKLGIRPVTIKSGEFKDAGSPFDEMSEGERRLLQNIVFDMYRQFFSIVLKARHERIETMLRQRPEQFYQVANTTGTKEFGPATLEWSAFPIGSVANEVGATTESETALRQVADGRILTGDQALKLGLIDQIGTLHDAVERAAKMADLDEDPPVIDKEPKSDLPAWLGASAGRFWQEMSTQRTGIELRQNY